MLIMPANLGSGVFILTMIFYHQAALSDKTLKNYVAKGITVCERWVNSFETFLADMGRKPTPKHSIERKNSNGNYEPDNCRWATPKEQGRNTSQNHMVTLNGVTKTVSEWTEIVGLNPKTVWSRYQYGYSDEEVFNPNLMERKTSVTKDQVLEIRSSYIPRVFGYPKLAKKYGVSESCIQAIIERKSWKNI